MKTPYAIVIGLALIAAALFFREPSVPPAQAGPMPTIDGFQCFGYGGGMWPEDKSACYLLHGDSITLIQFSAGFNISRTGTVKLR
jgi:hypothetical protein